PFSLLFCQTGQNLSNNCWLGAESRILGIEVTSPRLPSCLVGVPCSSRGLLSLCPTGLAAIRLRSHTGVENESGVLLIWRARERASSPGGSRHSLFPSSASSRGRTSLLCCQRGGIKTRRGGKVSGLT